MNSVLLQVSDFQPPPTNQIIGRSVQIHNEVSSTNTMALGLSDNPDHHGLVIFAESQSAGRGRFNRTWHAPKAASILASVLLFLKETSSTATSIFLWTALAIRQAIADTSAIDSLIQWPNDLLVNKKKVCGILIESRPSQPPLRTYAVGIGINCLQHKDHFPPEIRHLATSLELESPVPVDRTLLARNLLRTLDQWLVKSSSLDPQQLKTEWLNHSLPLGKRLHLTSHGKHFSGSLVEIDPQAGIVLQLDHGGRRIFSPYSTSIDKMD